MYRVYILASRRHGTLYIGVTNDLRARLELHRMGLGSEFVKQYNVHRSSTLSRMKMPKTQFVARSS